ncbi:serine hydrolase [Erythrobacter sp. SD-21]|uniref:serine hydrolase domain-containing protein n=1 Tax=Erythrobacter sp. SD-21 TaxID=161528 RepID=UPI000153EF25|nr:serine hydrolase [Erythrobacter sp. SD-21]EDL50093.1 Beta-lactamase class C family protein [Erythrobacter sp. SD-21]
MIRHAFAATALLAATPIAAQLTTQDELDSRYDRALAAGYKALFLCSAIANAEAAGSSRGSDSVHKWELTAIYPNLDPIIRDLPFNIVRDMGGPLQLVSVEWDEDMPSRTAYYTPGVGCSVMPIGHSKPPSTRPQDSAIADLASAAQNPFGTRPSRAGMAVAETAFDGARYGPGTRTTAVVVVKDSDIVAERYAEDFGPNTPQRTWSVAKSLAATIVGAAVERRDADTLMRVPASGLTEGFDPRNSITVDHVLRMASGRYSDTPGNRTDPLYWGGTTVDERAMTWPTIYKPGTVYRYANNDTLAAVQAIERTFDRNPPAAIFARIGMANTVAETDWQGNYILSSQVWSTARDLAKLGQLYIDDGVLPNGERLLPGDWRAYVSAPTGPQPDGPYGYGAGFWLFNSSEGVPVDTFAAMGNRGQYVVIVPSMNVVIVRRGEDPAGNRFDIATFTRDVLESLRK